MHPAIRHAQTLIRFRSVTPEEAGTLRYLENELSAAGFTCHRLPFSQQGTPDVDNLYARTGTGSPHICFAGHVDVVPPGDETAWRHPPFAAAIEDGVLYGRGAADMKGGVAAALAAVLQFLGERGGAFGGSISFLLTADEEGPGINGTRKVVEWLAARGERPDACIVGESTSETSVGDIIKIGRRGSLSCLLKVLGQQGHAAYPEKARNPLPGMIDALNLLKSRPLDTGTAHFQPSNLEITSIDTGNPATNVIPAGVSARFNIRFNDLHTSTGLKAWIGAQVSEALAGRGLEYTLSYEPASESFLSEAGGFVETLNKAVAAETGTLAALTSGGGTSDARFIKDLCPVAELGLLNATAHKVDECASLDGIERLTAIYARFLQLTFA
jgi:succinyl-diaminopimelate desuccinylase